MELGSIRVALKNGRVEGKNSNKTKAQIRRESHKKRSQLIVVAIATKEKDVACTGVAGSAEGMAGAAVPLQAGGACQAALVPALCF